MKKLLLLVSVFILSCNETPKELEKKEDVIVDLPIDIKDTIVVSEEASDSLKEARIKAKDSIKNALGK